MGLTLLGIATSRAIRPLWAAAELQLDFHHVPTPFLRGATRTPEFLALNPNGHIPVLVDQTPEGEVTVWESMACALYIARQYGAHNGVDISPANAREEADALRWSFWAVNELEKDALTVLMHRLAMPPEQRKPELAEAAEKRLPRPLALIEQHLQQAQARGHAYLSADRFTVADLCLASVTGWVRPARELLAAYPLTKDWLKTCLSREAHTRWL